MRHSTPIALLLAPVALFGACSPSPAPDPSQGHAANPVLAPAARIDAIPGSLVVVPIDPSWVFDVERGGIAQLDDGRKLNVRFFRVQSDAVAQFEGAGPRRQEWLPAPAIWSSSPYTAPLNSPPSRPSTPVLAIEFPATPGGKFLDIAGKRWSVNWVLSPGDIFAQTARTPEAQEESLVLWRPTMPPAGAVSPVLAAYGRPESLSPIGRWRYRMLTDGLAPPGAASEMAAFSPLPPFEDLIIEAIARQNEARWRSALALLWSVDSDLAWRLKLRLTCVMDFGEGVVAPAWPTDHAILDLLLADLLDPVLSPSQRARRAAEWLEAQPPALAWVTDDAGIIDARTGLGIASIAIGSQGERSSLAWAEAEGSRAEPDLHPALPATVVRLAVSPIEASRRGGVPALVTAHLGRWSRELRVVSRPLPLTPPGLTVGPFLPDLTLNSWQQESRAHPTSPAWATVARLHALQTRATRAAAFELYVECKSDHDPAAWRQGDEDVVRAWLGPTAAPFAVLRVTASGAFADELTPNSEPRSIPIVRTATGWSFHLPIPPNAIERDGLLRLALDVNRNAPRLGQRALRPLRRRVGDGDIDKLRAESAEIQPPSLDDRVPRARPRQLGPAGRGALERARAQLLRRCLLPRRLLGPVPIGVLPAPRLPAFAGGLGPVRFAALLRWPVQCRVLPPPRLPALLRCLAAPLLLGPRGRGREASAPRALRPLLGRAARRCGFRFRLALLGRLACPRSAYRFGARRA